MAAMAYKWELLRSILWKNLLLKTRLPVSTSLEILLPATIMIMLMAVRTQVSSETHPTTAYINKDMFVRIGASKSSMSFGALLEYCDETNQTLAIAPDSEFTRKMLRTLAFRYPLLKTVADVYKDEATLEAYLQAPWYGQPGECRNVSHPVVKGAVVFHETGPLVYDYSIRLNHTWRPSGFPDVTSIMDTTGPYNNDLQLGLSIIGQLEYTLSGFMTLQQIFDSYVIYEAQRRERWSARAAGSGDTTETLPVEGDVGRARWRTLVENEESQLSRMTWGGYNESEELQNGKFSNLGSFASYLPTEISIAPFPTSSYRDDHFQTIIKAVMGVLYILAFLFPVSRLLRSTVLEKELCIKEGMRIMGLPDGIHYIAWWITYTIQFALTVAVLTAVASTTIFEYSQKSVVFTYFFIFGLSSISFCFLLSAFFSRAKTASAVGTLTFLATFFPYYTVRESTVSGAVKVVSSLLAPTAFALGTVNFADYENAHVGLRWSNIFKPSSGVNFGVCGLMMLLDTALYAVAGWYLDKVLPQEFGVQLPWYFLFTRKYWAGSEASPAPLNRLNKRHARTDGAFPLDGDLEAPLLSRTAMHFEVPPPDPEGLEEPLPDLVQLEEEGRCVQLRRLRKVFPGVGGGRVEEGGGRVAVAGLDLTMYEGQILALLGHNGAGKSTTIAMLTGLLPPTSGDAIVNGRSICKDLVEIRRMLGVCPQHDILFPDLTVREHLQLFATVKGVRACDVDAQADAMVAEVGLADKAHVQVLALSGGMKRKLSVGIALIGDSKVVILDEPTSGMDPYSQRATWKLLKRRKKGRVVLLTTHSMEEADVLGDRIAILSNGYLRCCGSPLFLKHRYGVGYTLTVVKADPASEDVTPLVRAVERHVASAVVLAHAGAEVAFRLPLAATPAFQGLFEELDGYIRRAKQEGTANNKETSTSEDSLYIDSVTTAETACDLPLDIASYGVSVTTLEEVFLRVAARRSDESSRRAALDLSNVEQAQYDVEDNLQGSPSPLTGNPHGSDAPQRMGDPWERERAHVPPGEEVPHGRGGAHGGGGGEDENRRRAERRRERRRLKGKAKGRRRRFSSSGEGMGGLPERRCGGTFWRHVCALVTKRAIAARRDRRAMVFQLLIPVAVVMFGLLILRLKPHPNQPSVLLTTSHFNKRFSSPQGGAPLPFNLSEPIARKVAAHVQGGPVQPTHEVDFRFPRAAKTMADAIGAAGKDLGPDLVSLSEFLITSRSESGDSRYGAVLMPSPHADGSLRYSVLHNTSSQHALPTFVNVVNDAILKVATDNANCTLRTRNHPLPMSFSQHILTRDISAFSAAIIINVAFSFIPASFAVSIVKEREVKAKHQQIVSGVSVLAYWVSTFWWDVISYILLPCTLSIALFFLFGVMEFIGPESLLPTILMMVGYGPAVASLTYCLTFFFSDHSTAQNVVLLVHFFAGLILMVTSFIMSLIKATAQVNLTLKNVFRLSPGFCLADGLASLALRHQKMHGVPVQPFAWNTTGGSITYLYIEAVVYFLITLLVEYIPTMRYTVSRIWYRAKAADAGQVAAPDDEDADVAAERRRVTGPGGSGSLVRLVNLRKVYRGGMARSPKTAVQSLSFGVDAGECFGFLGVNGAGKTTTLSMLSGEFPPSDGSAYIVGNDITLNQTSARRVVGYCPQFDALLDLLTPREHLELYGRIKGVPETLLPKVVEEKLREMELSLFASTAAANLSGGNKRKLSVAVAMVGDPPIVILDEPSTGMDPVARRFMWDVITDMSTRRGRCAVLLTTHSMAEAQALCTRIAIMVGGRLRCIGSPQHLKSRFGNALELEVKTAMPKASDVDRLCDILRTSIPGLLRMARTTPLTHDHHTTSHPPLHHALSLSSDDLDTDSIRTIESLDGNPEDRAFHDAECWSGSEWEVASSADVNLGANRAASSAMGCAAVVPLSALVAAAHALGDASRANELISGVGASSEAAEGEALLSVALRQQLSRDGWVPARALCEWWLACERAMTVDSFIRSSFSEASLLERNGSNFRYQLPFKGGLSLAHVFGHMETHRNSAGIVEYSVGQTTLEAIFNGFAARQEQDTH